MKWLVWFLVLANVALLAYFNIGTIAPKSVAFNKAISPEKLQVLAEKDLEAMPKKMVAVPAPAAAAAQTSTLSTSCYKWGNFTTTNLPSAQVVLVRMGLEGVVNQEPVAQQDRRFWVYYPPLKTAELARQKAEEIKALGVDELFIVQDSQWRHAISFGLFSDEILASNLLSDLQAKGLKGATKALRNPGKALSSLLIKAVSAEAVLELHKIKHEFVGTEIAPTACP